MLNMIYFILYRRQDLLRILMSTVQEDGLGIFSGMIPVVLVLSNVFLRLFYNTESREIQKQPLEVFRGFRNFAKFTGKHLRPSLSFDKVAGGLQLYLEKRLCRRVTRDFLRKGRFLGIRALR